MVPEYPITISVVIGSINGPDCLIECLESLQKQEGNISSEVIVADCDGNETIDSVAERFPDFHFHHFAERKTIPQLRGYGLLRARGRIIATTEDHCIAPGNWYLEILKAHEKECDAAGGSIENAATDRLIDYAVFFCEYLRYMNPGESIYTYDIPGPNASYKREMIDLMRDLIEEGYWENWLHARLQEKRKKVLYTPEMMMWHKKSFGFFEFLSQRYHYGRGYAGMRNATFSFRKRLIYILFSPLIPPLLLSRMFHLILQKKRNYKEFLLSFPYLIIFTIVWALGEWVGYIFGPGNSMYKVE